MNVSLIDAWRRHGCASTCVPRRHDLDAHEGWGFRLALLAQRTEPARVVETGPLVVDLEIPRVAVGGRAVHLTATEVRMLLVLARRPGRMVSCAEILTATWGPEYVGEDHLLRVNVARLRVALGPAGDLIRTEPALGYRLELIPRGAAPTPRARAVFTRRRPPRRWAWEWERCACCGRTDRPHAGHGRCARCRNQRTRRNLHYGPCQAPPLEATS